MSASRKKIFQHFTENVSVKGVPKIVKANNPCLKCLWVIAVLLGLVIGLWQIIPLVSSYLHYTTSLATMEVRNENGFPDITICYLNTDAIDMPGILNYTEYVNMLIQDAQNFTEEKRTPFAVAKFKELLTRQGYLQYIRKSYFRQTYLQPGFVVDAKFEQWPWMFNKSLINRSSMLQNYTTYSLDPNHGPCITFRASRLKYIESFVGIFYLADVLSIVTKPYQEYVLNANDNHGSGLKTGLYQLLIHEPGTFPDIMKAIDVPAGHETTITLQLSNRIRMGRPYGSCTDIENIPYEGATEYVYNGKTCELFCQQSKTIEMCNCISHLKISTNELQKRLYFCGWYNSTSVQSVYEKQKCAMNVRVTKECVNTCPLPCDEMKYSTMPQFNPWPHEKHHLSFYTYYIADSSDIKEKHYFDEAYSNLTLRQNQLSDTVMIKKLKEIDLIKRNFAQISIKRGDVFIQEIVDNPSISLETLAGTLGGILNLWVGFTFITVIEIVELLYRILFPERNKNCIDLQHTANNQDVSTLNPEIDKKVNILAGQFVVHGSKPTP